MKEKKMTIVISGPQAIGKSTIAEIIMRIGFFAGVHIEIIETLAPVTTSQMKYYKRKAE